MTPIGSPVNAQIGLVERLRRSLSQISTRMFSVIGAAMPWASSSAEIAWMRRETIPSGSPSVNLFLVIGEFLMIPGSATSLAELTMQPRTRSWPISRASAPSGSSRDRSGAGAFASAR